MHICAYEEVIHYSLSFTLSHIIFSENGDVGVTSYLWGGDGELSEFRERDANDVAVVEVVVRFDNIRKGKIEMAVRKKRL